MELHEELAGILKLLERHQVDYALCGGLAVRLQG
jgi:hypothetical protein